MVVHQSNLSKFRLFNLHEAPYSQPVNIKGRGREDVRVLISDGNSDQVAHEKRKNVFSEKKISDL